MLVHHYPSPLVDTALVKLPKKIIIQMKENYVYIIHLCATYIAMCCWLLLFGRARLTGQ